MGVTSAGTVPARSARAKNRWAAARSRRPESKMSMTWPYWSTARYRHAHWPATLREVSSAGHRVTGSVAAGAGGFDEFRG